MSAAKPSNSKREIDLSARWIGITPSNVHRLTSTHGVALFPEFSELAARGRTQKQRPEMMGLGDAERAI
jgi:hypothetical protein